MALYAVSVTDKSIWGISISGALSAARGAMPENALHGEKNPPKKVAKKPVDFIVELIHRGIA